MKSAPGTFASSIVALLAVSTISSPLARACERNCRTAFLGPVFEWYTPRITKAYDVFRSTLVLGLDEQQASAVRNAVEPDVAAWRADALSPEKRDLAIQMIFAGGNQDRTKTIWGGECCSCCSHGNCRSCPGGTCNDNSKYSAIIEEFRKGQTLCGSEYAARAYMPMVLTEAQRYALGEDVDTYASKVVSTVQTNVTGVTDQVLQQVSRNAKLALDNLKNAYGHLSDGLQSSVGEALADHFICTDHRYDQRNGPRGDQDNWEACRSFPQSNYVPPAPDMSGGKIIPDNIDGFFVPSAQNASTNAGSTAAGPTDSSANPAEDSAENNAASSITATTAVGLFLFSAAAGAICYTA